MPTLPSVAESVTDSLTDANTFPTESDVLPTQDGERNRKGDVSLLKKGDGAAREAAGHFSSSRCRCSR